MNIEQEIQRLYDDYVMRNREAKTGEAQAAITEEVADLLSGVDRDVVEEARNRIQYVIRASRRVRKKTLREDAIEYILDAAFDEDGAYVDPILGLAFPLGVETGGTDKTLRYWTSDDFAYLVNQTYRKAAEATAAARALDERTEPLIDLFKVRGAVTVDDLLRGTS